MLEAYWRKRGLFYRVWFKLRHPYLAVKAVKAYGFWTVLRVLWTGELLPPPLKEWATLKGFPRKHTPAEALVDALGTMRNASVVVVPKEDTNELSEMR